MKKTGIINSEVSAVVANMGHMDWLSIGDAGMPVPFGTKKIDLAVDKELPSFMDVLRNVLKEMKVQKIYLADEIKEQNPKQLENIKQALPEVEIEFMPHRLTSPKADSATVILNGCSTARLLHTSQASMV